MNFGQKGRELLQELKRSDWLPLYSEDAVSRCLLECQGHMAQIRPALAQEMVSECRWDMMENVSGHISVCDDGGKWVWTRSAAAFISRPDHAKRMCMGAERTRWMGLTCNNAGSSFSGPPLHERFKCVYL